MRTTSVAGKARRDDHRHAGGKLRMGVVDSMLEYAGFGDGGRPDPQTAFGHGGDPRLEGLRASSGGDPESTYAADHEYDPKTSQQWNHAQHVRLRDSQAAFGRGDPGLQALSGADSGSTHVADHEDYDRAGSQQWNQSHHVIQPQITGEGHLYHDTRSGRNLQIVMRDTDRRAFGGTDLRESSHLDGPEGEGRQGIQAAVGKAPNSSSRNQGSLRRPEHGHGLAAASCNAHCTHGSTYGSSATSYELLPTEQKQMVYYTTHPSNSSVTRSSHRMPSVRQPMAPELAYRKLEARYAQALHYLEQSERENADLRSRLVIEESRRIEIVQKLERQEALHLQQAQPESGSYQDSAATPPLLQNATDGVKEAIVVCAREFYDSLRKSSNIVVHFPVEWTSKEVVKAGLQAMFCRVLFQNFEDPYFSIGQNDMPLFRTPSERKSALFQDFKRCRDYSDPKKLLQDDEDFRNFFYCKTCAMNSEIGASLRASKDAHIAIETLDNGLLDPVNESSLYRKAFLRTAKNVWVVHKLAMAFEPIAEIFRVRQSSSLNEIYMEDIATHDDDDDDDDDVDAEGDANMEVQKQVMFMCVPGFTVRRTVIKSKVFCLPNVQPEAHDTEDFANPGANGAASDDPSETST